MYWCFLLQCVPGMALVGRSDSVLVFLVAVCTWDGVDAAVDHHSAGFDPVSP